MTNTAAAPRARAEGQGSRRGFKRGDRVQFTGAGKEWLGVVVESDLPGGQRSIHPGTDDTAVYVKFDDTGITIPVSMRQLQKVSDRRR